MTVIWVLVVSILALGLAGRWYSQRLARWWGEDLSRAMPSAVVNDGRDYVPTPTPVVFAHHYASIAGAGPIIGPVIALCYGWLPALIWVLAGGVLVGGVHDYLATHMAVREGGQSIATVARRLLGTGPFIGLMLFLVIVLALVCATFLNLSATALTSMVPHARLGLAPGQAFFREVGSGADARIVIGGIASTSVIVITLIAPCVGWLYIRKRVPVWRCSILAILICGTSIAIGLAHPVALPDTAVLGPLTGTDIWKFILAGYVLIAAGLPVWMFLQSRDFINVHILYAGLAGLVLTLLVAGLRNAGPPTAAAIPVSDIAAGQQALGTFWPALFITIACGAVSGFHSLCAGGTTCKQLNSEAAVRRVSYWAMLLESLLAVCVIAVVMLGATRSGFLADVHPKLMGLTSKANPILGFAMAVGNAGSAAFGAPVAVGALAGMVLLEGFLVTTLDTAVRLMRYLLEEVWQVLFGAGAPVTSGAAETGGSDGIPADIALGGGGAAPAPRYPHLARFLGYYWVNSGIAVGLMLWFAFSGGIMALWGMFATANQLLAAFVLLLGALWLQQRRRAVWSALIPAAFMLATTVANLLILLRKYTAAETANRTLLGADVALLALSVYLCMCWVGKAVRLRRA
jgi:carbon starvation protein